MPITISKAIEILELNIHAGKRQMPPDVRDAVNLGIEALKGKLADRRHGVMSSAILLPGETPPKPLHAIGFNTGDDESP